MLLRGQRNGGNWWAVILVPAVGGLLCGLLVYGFAPEAEGHGTDAMVRAFHRLGGKIRARVPLIKSLASIITIGTGGSAGREGPIAQIGAGFGSFLASKAGLSERERRLLVLAGAAGGIGAIFRAPLGGALFVSEVLYASTALEFAAVIPAFIASITAYTVFAAIFGQGLAFITSGELGLQQHQRVAVLPGICRGVFACGLSSTCRSSTVCAIIFSADCRFPTVLKPAVGGLMLGMFAVWLPQLMSGGYGWIQLAMDGKLTLAMLAILCFGKIVATSFTISSGGSGGVFAPSLFIGAMLGGAYGIACDRLFPGAIEHHEAFVLVGMGGFFAGVAKVPLTAILMVCEMSGSYDLLVPLMLVSIVNVALLSSRHTLYEEQVSAMIDSPAHQGDFIIDVLEQLHVRDVIDPQRKLDIVPEDMPLDKILHLAASSENTYFPVVDQENRLVGIFSLRDLRAVLTGNRDGRLVLATDLATQPVSDGDAGRRSAHRPATIHAKEHRRHPGRRPAATPQIIGMLSRRHLISAYHDRVSELQGNAADSD